MQRDIGLLILRLGFGGFMLFSHGWSKLVNFSEIAPNFPDPIGLGGQVSLALAVFAEVFCAAALMLGIFTRFVSIPLIITMLVAAFIVHSADPIGKKEFALLYNFVFMALFFTGAGDFSVDKFLKK